MIDVQKIWLTPTEVWIQTSDGKQACEHFADYKGLRNATEEERKNYTLSPYGIHWEQLDEDLCYEGFFARAEA
jgi:hypothetical protein